MLAPSNNVGDYPLADQFALLFGGEFGHGLFHGSYKITAGLLAESGRARVRDTPIAKRDSSAPAMLGLRPAVKIMTVNFSLPAIDQIVNHGAKMHAMLGGQVTVPIVIRTPGGGRWLAATRSQKVEVW